MTWYAIRTAPGAQMPRREYWAEPLPSAIKGEHRGKGYRIASSTNPERSAVETALENAGFTFYMPAEFTAVRNRRSKGLYEVRRFALLKGYVFVTEVASDQDWSRLLSLPGVLGMVSSGDKPFPIDDLDIFRLRMFEVNSRAEATARAARLTTIEAREGRKDRKKAAKAARRKLFPGKPVRLIWGDKVGREATVAAWHDEEHVRVLVEQLDAVGESVTVPYDFLRAAE